MVVLVGQMQLPVTEDPDPVRTYLNGTAPSGGLWTALTRASDHDHSGGLNGKTIGVASIPDGSITTAKLDPSVLLPYTLVDGSKPHTGQQAFNADALVRDTLYFGAKPAGVGDANLKRTGANAFQFSGNVGVGVAPAAWAATVRVVQVGGSGSIGGNDAAAGLNLRENVVAGAGGNTAIFTGAASQLSMTGGAFYLYTASSVAAGAAQTFTTRLTVDQAGNVGVGVTPAGWGANHTAVQIGLVGALWGNKGTAGSTFLSQNEYFDGTTRRAIEAGVGVGELQIDQAGELYFHNRIASGVTAGMAVTNNTRLRIAGNGTVTLTPDGGQHALIVQNGGIIPGDDITRVCGDSSHHWASVSTYSIRNDRAGDWMHTHSANGFRPIVDNANHCGGPSNRWNTVYAVAGAINTCSIALKEIVGEMDDATALGQLMGLPAIYRFHYKHNVPVEGADPEAPEAEQFALETDTSMEFIGPVAEEMPADMKVGDVVAGSVNTEGHLMAALRGAVKEFRARLDALEAVA